MAWTKLIMQLTKLDESDALIIHEALIDRFHVLNGLNQVQLWTAIRVAHRELGQAGIIKW